MSDQYVEELFSFIEKSPTAYHAVRTMEQELIDRGYTELYETKQQELMPGGKYFVTRGGSSLIAFRIPAKTPTAFRIMASHSDSPMFKIKENPEITVENHYVKLNVEKYGGMLCAPWFDRPLSVAGRLIVRTENGMEVKLVDAAKPMLMLPSLAIHMNREANNGTAYNIQKDMLPLYGDGAAAGTFMKKMADLAGVEEKDIISHDLYVYCCTKGTVWGDTDEFLSSGRLDDLECAFASMKAFLLAETSSVVSEAMMESGLGEGEVENDTMSADDLIPVHCVFDNEEVGSGTRQGAGSTFLADTLERIAEVLGISPAGYRRMLARSFMLSADNAHAVHPAYPDKACPTNRPYMNEGIVVKFSANQKYTTDGISAGIFRSICAAAGAKCQVFFNRSDILGGSTLGNISVGQVAVNTVDIGLPQLAMHSPYETAGTKDLESMILAAEKFFRTEIAISGGQFIIR